MNHHQQRSYQHSRFSFFHFLRLQQQPKAPLNFRHHCRTSDITADTSNDLPSRLNCLARNFLKVREILTSIYDFFALCVSKATLEFSLGFVHICIINFFHLFIVLHSAIVKVEKKSALTKRKKVQSLWCEICHISTFSKALMFIYLGTHVNITCKHYRSYKVIKLHLL